MSNPYTRNALVQLRIPSFGIYPGQIIDVTHNGQMVHVKPILRTGETLKKSPHLGKTYIRSVDDYLNLFPLKEFEDYLNMGLDKYWQFDVALESERQRVNEIEEKAAEKRRQDAARVKKQKRLEQTGQKIHTCSIVEVIEEKQVSVNEVSEVENLNQIQKREMRTIHMPLVFRKSELPVLRVGKAGGSTVSVRENGQIGFSSEVAKNFVGFTHCIIEWDENRVMSFTPADPKKQYKGSDGKIIKSDDLMPIAQAKNDARYISAAAILRQIDYDYKVGSYSFDATIDEKTKKVSFTLPEKMDVKAKTPRKPRAKGASATGGATEVVNAGEPELQPA